MVAPEKNTLFLSYARLSARRPTAVPSPVTEPSSPGASGRRDSKVGVTEERAGLAYFLRYAWKLTSKDLAKPYKTRNLSLFEVL